MTDELRGMIDLARESLANARTLTGGSATAEAERDFLERMARSDRLLDHPDAATEAGTCGLCAHRLCCAEAARQVLAEGDTAGGIARWSERMEALWAATKYVRLCVAEREAGRNPAMAFAERGWTV